MRTYFVNRNVCFIDAEIGYRHSKIWITVFDYLFDDDYKRPNSSQVSLVSRVYQLGVF